jgi:hypothetical protein
VTKPTLSGAWWIPLAALAATAHADRIMAPPPDPFANDVAVHAMRDELARSIDQLQLEGFGTPFTMSYEFDDSHHAAIEASFGALVTSSVEPSRSVAIDLHVGSYTLDNSNFASTDRFNRFDSDRVVVLPLDNEYDAIRRALWLATDHAYKRAVETLEHKRAVAKAEAKNADDVDSYSKAVSSSIVDDHPVPALDRARLEALAKKLSGVFRNNPDVHVGKVAIHAGGTREVFVSSEGWASVQAGSFVRVTVDCETQAEDGMPLRDHLAWFAETADQLPPENELVAQVEQLSKQLSALRTAPVVDDYAGPIVFDGVAAPDLLRTLLADELAGTPAVKSDHAGAQADASALAGKVGQRVLPAGTTVVDDPTIKRLGTQALGGATRFDDEGVPAAKVSLIEDGVFKRFLMSRIPRKGFPQSNGHGVATAFSAPRAHPMNVIVSSTRGVADAELRRRAFAAAKDAGVRYVLYVDRFLSGRSSRDDLDSSAKAGENLPRPAVMRRVYLDGHEELVRGGKLGELPLKALKDMLAIGNKPAVSNSGAGYMASIAAPALLFKDVDVKRPTGTHKKPPIAARPR